MKQILQASFIVAALSLPIPIFAANINIVGGTNGAQCNSGGYFTPSQISTASGDTITISVPANDPYSGGLQVHGFPEGNFTILPGASHTTSVLTSTVSFFATWPSTGCMKGSGNVTVVAAPAPAPAATPTPAHVPVSTPVTSAVKPLSPGPKPSVAASTSPKPSTTPAVAVSQGSSASSTPSLSPNVSPATRPADNSSHHSTPSLFLAASTGVIGLGVLAAAAVIWIWIKRRLQRSVLEQAKTPR